MDLKITFLFSLLQMVSSQVLFGDDIDYINVWKYKQEAQEFFTENDISNVQQHLAEELIASLKLDNFQYLENEALQTNISSECYSDFSVYVDGLTGLDKKQWALKMADSTGKMEAGIIQGNGLFEGRYVQCTKANDDIEEADRVIEPLYCLAFWPTPIPNSYRIYLRGLGMCIPNTCTDDDAHILLKQVYRPLLLPFRDVFMKCRRGEEELNTEAIITIIILSLFGLLVLMASVYDVYKTNATSDSYELPRVIQNEKPGQETTYENKAFSDIEVYKNKQGEISSDKAPTADITANIKEYQLNGDPTRNQQLNGDVTKSHGTAIKSNTENSSTSSTGEKMLLSFSLYKNVPVIVSSKQPDGAIGCLNGIRFIAMCCVILGHTFGFAVPVSENWWPFFGTDLEDTINAKMISMDLYVDTFFILSAFLVSLSFLKQLKRRGGRMGIGFLSLHYFNRYWRLTPTYMIILMIYTNLLHYFAKGPFVPDNFPDADVCSTEWWKNLLYINNFFIKDGQMCMAWSWYLAIDMQLFIIAPLFLYLLYRWEKVGIVAVVLSFLGGLIANCVLFEQYYTQEPGENMSSDEEIYFKPWTRCPVYFMGMLLGYIFYKTNGSIKLPKIVVITGWIVAISLYFIVSYVPSLWDGCYHQTVLINCDWTIAGHLAWSSLFRPMWGLWVCWLVTACASGYGGVINTFLSWNFFVPLSRYTYLGYLIHPVLIFSFYLNTPVQLYATKYFLSYMFFANLLVVNLFSLVLLAVISAPLTRLAVIFLPTGRNQIR